MAAAGADLTERRKQRIPDLMLEMDDPTTNLRSTKLADTKIIHANESNYKKDMVAAPGRGRAVEARQVKVAGEYTKAVQAMDQKYLGTAPGVVGPTERALADHSHGGVVGLVFGAFGECSQSVDLLVESFGKLIGEQGYAEMGYRTPEVGVGVATWAIRREWAMTHWRESANLMWRNLEHVTGAYSEHAKKKRYEHRREAWGDAHRAAGTHRENGTSRKRGHRALRRDASGDVRA